MVGAKHRGSLLRLKVELMAQSLILADDILGGFVVPGTHLSNGNHWFVLKGAKKQSIGSLLLNIVLGGHGKMKVSRKRELAA